MEHGHGGFWNAETYDTREVVSINMKACYAASIEVHGEAALWFERFGHLGHCMTRVSINGPLPPEIGQASPKSGPGSLLQDAIP